MKSIYSGLVLALIRAALFTPSLAAQEPNPTSTQDQQDQGQVQMRNGIAYYKVQVVDRTFAGD